MGRTLGDDGSGCRWVMCGRRCDVDIRGGVVPPMLCDWRGRQWIAVAVKSRCMCGIEVTVELFSEVEMHATFCRRVVINCTLKTCIWRTADALGGINYATCKTNNACARALSLLSLNLPQRNI
jgi:hypothetical protein